MSGGLSEDIDRELKEAAGLVAEEARSLFVRYDARSAAGFRPRTKGFGRALVEQRRRRTTGRHPEFGALQMRKALLPGLWHKANEVEHRLEEMIDRLGGRYGF